MMWVKKYQPQKLSEVAGNKESMHKLRSSVENKKCVLLTGPTGSGKTCAVESLSNELNADLIEMNASDVRTKNAINDKLLAASRQRSLFMRPKILLIDEADGLTSSGITAVKELVDQSKFPVVITGNDAWKLKSLKSVCESIELRNPTVYQVRDFLNKIAENEGIQVDKGVLKQVASQTGKDVRAAVNDFEQIARGKDKVVMSDLEQLGYRDREKVIFDALKIIFKTRKLENARRAIENVDLDPNMLMLWIEENIPREYERMDDMANAYDAVSRADVFAGRIRRRQDWSLMKYQINNMTIGVALAKKEMYRKFTRYFFPKYLSRMSKSRSIRRKKEQVFSKVGKICHCSISQAEDYLPLLKEIGKKLDWLEKDDLKIIKSL